MVDLDAQIMIPKIQLLSLLPSNPLEAQSVLKSFNEDCGELFKRKLQNSGGQGNGVLVLTKYLLFMFRGDKKINYKNKNYL